MTSIACLIATWRDGGLLDEAVASAAPHVDVVIVLDGGYAGVVPWDDLHTPPGELYPVAERSGVKVFAGYPSGWLDEIAKRNVLLELGRAFLPDAVDRWALVLDADEVLVNGEHLRPYLDDQAADDFPTFAPGLDRLEPNGAAWRAPSRLFRLTEFVRYAERSYWLADPLAFGEEDVDLSHVLIAPAELEEFGPDPWHRIAHVQHRWDRRPPWRRDIQRRYGRILAERDHGTG